MSGGPGCKIPDRHSRLVEAGLMPAVLREVVEVVVAEQGGDLYEIEDVEGPDW